MQKQPQRIRALAAGVAIAAAVVAMAPAARAANAADCPNDGVVRFGVEPFDTSTKLVPIYDHIGKLLGEKIGCEVKIYIATNYNAEIEAMRSGKLEIGEFGPLGYVLAHQIAKAQAVAAFSSRDGKPDTYWASLVTYPGSGIKTVAEIRGHSFAFSDPASTSGHLFPAYGLRKAGIDPDKDIKALYAVATRRPTRRFTTTRSMLANSTASNWNRPRSAGTTSRATWFSCGNPTRSPPIRSPCAGIWRQPSRRGLPRRCKR
jgi:phosphate/phosphite/phosphonate ABC transporter binding protein